MIIENSPKITQNKIGAVILMAMQIIFIVFYGVFIRYEEVYPNQEDLEVTIGLAILVLVGFGLTLSYLKDAGLSGMGFTLLITSIVFQFFFLINAFWSRAGIQASSQRFGDGSMQHVGLIMGQNTIETPVNIYPFTKLGSVAKISGDFTAWAALKCSLAMVVAFSALIGRAGILEISIMIPIGTIVYELNSQIMSRYAYDLGSSMRVFLFGGLFGFVCSWAMRNMGNTVHPTFIKYTSSRFNSTLAVLGSIFCFVLFPLLAQQTTFTNVQIPIYNYMKFACTVNVVLAMTASVVVSSLVSMIFGFKIGMRDFINSSIAGGIAIASSSGLITNPAAALIVGIVAGGVQVLWSRFIQRCVNELSIIDSLSSLGLFALSGFQGGLWIAIFSGIQSDGNAKSFFYANKQNAPQNFQMYLRSAGEQIGALFMTMAIAFIGGGLTGWILYFINKNSAGQQFNDSTYWKVEDDGISYRDIHALNMSSQYSNYSGHSGPAVVNIPPPEVVLPMMSPPLPSHAPIVSPIIRPGSNITGPCSYL